MAEYVAKFYELERHAYMLTKERRVDHFVRGLSGGLRTLVDNACPTSFDQALNLAHKQETNLKEDRTNTLKYLGVIDATFSMGVSGPKKKKDQPKNWKSKGKGKHQRGNDFR